MDLWQLNIFCKVIDHKGFSEAGKVVHLSQPTISSHIKDLEAHFECRLIDRMARKAIPTKAGRLLYRYAKQMIALKAETESAMAEFLGSIKGNIRIGGSTIPGAYILPQLIGSFTGRYPDVNITLIIADTEKIIQGVISGEIEMGVVGARSTKREITQVRLVEDEMQLVVPKGHKWAGKKSVPMEMIVKEPFILREKGSGTLTSIRNSFSEKDCDIENLNVVARIGSTEGIKQGIKTGMGISILSPIAVADDVAAGTMNTLSIEGLDLKRNFYLTRYKKRSKSPICRAFVDFIKTKTSMGASK